MPLFDSMYPQSFSLDDGTVVSFKEETPEDLEAIWTLYSTLGSESRKTLPPFNRNLIELWSRNLPDYVFKPVLVSVDEGSDERIIGRASLTHDASPASKHRAEFGIVVHDDYQGRGLGSNMTLFMIHVARSKGLKKLTLDVFADNSRAVHVFEACGYVKEGLFPDHYWFRGEFHDVIRMGHAL
ncbi:GNAT family N-acetyltransferase [Candidatus Bathyarchaeota archaeon]|nr:GNAT family N-acetyltransferase [Candidatus Bathyarchaeota archaeon]